LTAKVEDMKTVPEKPVGVDGEGTSATDAANQALDEALNPGFSLAGPSTQVNDLSLMVKKKKKAPAATNGAETNGTSGTTHLDTGDKTNGKRKAEDDAMEVTTPVEKKVKLADEETSATAAA